VTRILFKTYAFQFRRPKYICWSKQFVTIA